jgi:predicted metal-dependent enzyme (double-stranded beta helix superfamily)
MNLGRRLFRLAAIGNAWSQETTMADTFEAFCTACREAVQTEPLPAALETVRRGLEGLLHDAAFVARHCGPDAEPGIHRLYQDPETGMNVLLHVYAEGKESPPHDHGASWAVYGQVVGRTEMTVWRRTDEGSAPGKASVEPVESYTLGPGMAGFFPPGAIHSIKFEGAARVVRVTGTDLSAIPTRRFNLEQGTVLEDVGLSGVVRR